MMVTINEDTNQDEIKTSPLKDKLKSITNELGIENAFKIVGGIEAYVKVVYNGDLKNFFKESGIKPYKIVEEPSWGYNAMPSMLINEFLVNQLNLYTNDLGKFRWGPKKNDLPYTAFCDLNLPSKKLEYGLNYYKVKGYGSGYSFGYETNKNPVPKTYRLQIFKQIINKYDLDSYK